MNTAVEDGKIRRNRCRIKGAGQETGKRSGRSGTQAAKRLTTITNAALITPPTWAGATERATGIEPA